ncbi:MAG: extensin family protein [bacterium]
MTGFRRRTALRMSRVGSAFDSRGAEVLPPTWSSTPPRTRASVNLPRPRPLPSLSASSLAGSRCLGELRALGIPFQVGPTVRGIITPVLLTGTVNGVKLTPLWGRKPRLMDCRFAITLHGIAAIARRFGFDEFRYSSFYSYRSVAGSLRLSRHANGLAVDIHELRGPGGLRVSVLKDWVKAAGTPGDCVAGVKPRKGRLLRKFACELERSGLLYLVLTPDSDYAHRNHFHLSGLRAGNRPLRWRYAGRRYRLRP